MRVGDQFVYALVYEFHSPLVERLSSSAFDVMDTIIAFVTPDLVCFCDLCWMGYLVGR